MGIITSNALKNTKPYEANGKKGEGIKRSRSGSTDFFEKIVIYANVRLI